MAGRASISSEPWLYYARSRESGIMGVLVAWQHRQLGWFDKGIRIPPAYYNNNIWRLPSTALFLVVDFLGADRPIILCFSGSHLADRMTYVYRGDRAI
jgi:hypothetical protein